MLVVLELDISLLQAAVPLDIDHFRTIHHDFVNRVVSEQRFDWPETKDFSRYCFKEARPIYPGENYALGLEDFTEDLFNATPNLLSFCEVQLRIKLSD